MKCSAFQYPPLYFGRANRRPKQVLRNSQRKKRDIQLDTNNDIYNYDFPMKLKISLEGLVSLALVQLPAIALGILGILKAFVNNGFSKQAVKDSMRSVSKSGE